MAGQNREVLPIAFSALLIAALGIAVYANALDGPFILDDESLVVNNAYIKDPSRIPNFFTENIASGGRRSARSYRPLQMLTYMADHFLWGLEAKGFHLTNIILHILAALSLFWLIEVVFKRRLLSLFAACLFVVNPLHTEAVAYIAGRADSLAACFIFLALIFYIRLSTPLAVGFFACALLSRENAIVLPALVLLYHYVFKVELRHRRFIPVLAPLILYLLARATILRPGMADIAYPTTFAQRMPGFLVAMAAYARLLILPLGLHMEYGNIIFSPTDPLAITGAAILLSAILYFYKARRRGGIAFFAVSWFAITLLPQSNLVPINAYMAEHWLYLPSIGFFLVVADALCRLLAAKDFKIIALGLFVGLILFYSSLTVKQNRYWGDAETFYKRTMELAPLSFKAYTGLANIYSESGRLKEAEALYKKSLEIHPRNEHAYYNLGNIMSDGGHVEEAAELYRKAIEINPDYAEPYNNLGAIHYKAGKKEEGLGFYRKALELTPGRPEIYYNLGGALIDLGRKDEAAAVYRKVIALDPVDAWPYYQLANLLSEAGNKEEAVLYYIRAVEIDPANAEAYNNLGSACSDAGRLEEAVKYYNEALKLEPDLAPVHNNLARAYYRMGSYAMAVRHCDKVYELGYKMDDEFLALLGPHRK